MAYIGADPADRGIGLFSQDTFTGDGSTTTFDLTHEAPDGGGNDIQVFVDNVRQQEGSSKAYTLGQDGSGDNKRITFTTAPAASASIFVLNPGTKNTQQISTISDNTVTTAKLQALSVSTAKIAADAITEAKIADDAISEEHLDNTAITGHSELSAVAADDDVLLVFDTSAGTLKKVQRSNVALSAPTFSSVSPTSLTTGDGTGNHTIVVTGTKFDATATFKLRTDGGTDIAMDSVTRNSATQLTGVVAKSTANLTNSNEPFDVIIDNGSGLSTSGLNQINIDASPAFVTAAGTLGTVAGGSAITTIDVVAADPESAGNVVFDILTGGLPAGLSSATVNENGVSKFRITGTPTNPLANTTTTFTLRASDAASNTSTRAFSITVSRSLSTTSFTSSGTFAVPSGVTSLNSVLVVAGGGGGGGSPGWNGPGGGGAGGLIFMPCVSVTPGGTIAVTVGDGGAGGGGDVSPSGPASQGTVGQDSVFGASPSPGISAALTAKGGGGGGGNAGTPKPGGSGGGVAGGPGPGRKCGGSATQPTQPGNSGAYGFGNAGGSNPSPTFPDQLGGGGGGAGAAGGPSGVPGDNYSCSPAPTITSLIAPGIGKGGIGKAYTISDGTTSVYYAGGGSGHLANNSSATGVHVQGAQGGGGAGGWQNPGTNTATAGTANRGGGGGANRPAAGKAGGKGVVIVRF